MSTIPVPRGNRILVRPAEAPRKIGSIELPDNVAGPDADHGVVLRSASPDFRQGELVSFAHYSGTQLQVAGESFVLLNPAEILCSYEESS